MSEDIKTVEARLDVEIFVNCPYCDFMIDLLNENDTNDEPLNDDSQLIRQVFDPRVDYSDFECDEVTCSKCKSTFDVKRLEW